MVLSLNGNNRAWFFSLKTLPEGSRLPAKILGILAAKIPPWSTAWRAARPELQVNVKAVCGGCWNKIVSIEGDGTKVMQYHRYYTSAYSIRSQYFQPIPNVQHAVQRRTPMHQYDQRGNNITLIFDCQAQLHMEQADYDINKLGLSCAKLRSA